MPLDSFCVFASVIFKASPPLQSRAKQRVGCLAGTGIGFVALFGSVPEVPGPCSPVTKQCPRLC